MKPELRSSTTEDVVGSFRPPMQRLLALVLVVAAGVSGIAKTVDNHSLVRLGLGVAVVAAALLLRGGLSMVTVTSKTVRVRTWAGRTSEHPQSSIRAICHNAQHPGVAATPFLDIRGNRAVNLTALGGVMQWWRHPASAARRLERLGELIERPVLPLSGLESYEFRTVGSHRVDLPVVVATITLFSGIAALAGWVAGDEQPGVLYATEGFHESPATIDLVQGEIYGVTPPARFVLGSNEPSDKDLVPPSRFLSLEITAPDGQPVITEDVLYENAPALADSVRAKFTAPMTGTYLFVAEMEPGGFGVPRNEPLRFAVGEDPSTLPVRRYGVYLLWGIPLTLLGLGLSIWIASVRWPPKTPQDDDTSA